MIKPFSGDLVLKNGDEEFGLRNCLGFRGMSFDR